MLCVYVCHVMKMCRQGDVTVCVRVYVCVLLGPIAQSALQTTVILCLDKFSELVFIE